MCFWPSFILYLSFFFQLLGDHYSFCRCPLASIFLTFCLLAFSHAIIHFHPLSIFQFCSLLLLYFSYFPLCVMPPFASTPFKQSFKHVASCFFLSGQFHFSFLKVFETEDLPPWWETVLLTHLASHAEDATGKIHLQDTNMATAGGFHRVVKRTVGWGALWRCHCLTSSSLVVIGKLFGLALSSSWNSRSIIAI